MSNTQERRSKTDRRIVARGGRRPYDVPGSTPLVLVVGDGGDIVRQSEAILTQLKFAVAPAATVGDALRIAAGIHPDIIVARPEHASELRAAPSVEVPIVEYGSDTAPDSSLVSRVRDALRKRRN